MFATGVTMGLAEWIIEDTCLVYSISFKKYSLSLCIKFFENLHELFERL